MSYRYSITLVQFWKRFGNLLGQKMGFFGAETGFGPQILGRWKFLKLFLSSCQPFFKARELNFGQNLWSKPPKNGPSKFGTPHVGPPKKFFLTYFSTLNTDFWSKKNKVPRTKFLGPKIFDSFWWFKCRFRQKYFNACIYTIPKSRDE